ncbi:hypothetical protein BC943DRAFT_359460 [Umbelopsis sp. AD052]|nr:hypothetical protein BC943DRAFT_359460 [Umbelopsis sp. AD052]
METSHKTDSTITLQQSLNASPKTQTERLEMYFITSDVWAYFVLMAMMIQGLTLSRLKEPNENENRY